MIERFAPDVPLPRLLLVEASIPSLRLADAGAETLAQLRSTVPADAVRGKRIAIGAGSRGIDRIGDVVRAVAAFVHASGGQPFVIPCMGNHGGATAEGQQEILEGVGVSEAAVNAPIVPRMDTRQVGVTPAGTPVFVSEEALAADGVILVNRVKPHTDFDSTTIGSGLLKMAAIGLGRSEGAAACHRAGLKLGLDAVLPAVARVALGAVRLVAGVALIEDGRHQLARVDVLAPDGLAERETALFAEASRLMPALPFRHIDVLVIDQMGKDISGAGMDTNIIGRGISGQPRASRRADVGIIFVRGLTPASHGNAIGIGMADVASARLVNGLNRDAMFTNALSSMTPVTPKIPMHFDSDRTCLRAAVRLSGCDAAAAGIVRIRSTIALDRFLASETYLDEIEARSDLRIVAPPRPWSFDAEGNLPDGDWALGD